MQKVWNRLVTVFLLVSLCIPGIAVAEAWATELNLSAKAGVLMEATSGEVLYGKNMHTPLPMASITKIMTLVLVLEAVKAGKVSLDDIVTTSEYAKSMGGSQIWLEVGEQMTLKEMLYAIAVGSANDAAVAVAEFMSGSESAFVDLMNRRAQELGLTNTVFSNATGLPPQTLGMENVQHHSSAYDIAVLSRYALQLPMFLKLVSTYEYTMRSDTTGKPHLYSYNDLLERVLESGRRYGYPGMDGIKTGMTAEAGYCLAATAQREGLRFIAVVLGAATKEDRKRDIITLLNHGFRTYEPVTIARAGQSLGEARVARGKQETVSVSLTRDLVVGVPRGERDSLTREIVWKKEMVAPLQKGEVVGELVVKRNGKEITRVDVVTDAAVERGTIFQILIRMSKRLLRSIVPGR